MLDKTDKPHEALADLLAAEMAEVTEVIDDKKRGLVARLSKTGEADETAISQCLGEFTRPWEWADANSTAGAA